MMDYNKSIYVEIYMPDLPTTHATITSPSTMLRDASIRASCVAVYGLTQHKLVELKLTENQVVWKYFDSATSENVILYAKCKFIT